MRHMFMIALTLAMPSVAAAQQTTTGADNYSPYLNDFPNQVFFGDTHLHTSYSADAGFVGTTLGPEEAYRFALGEEIMSSTGVLSKLEVPLDFMVVADHAENLGLAPLAAAGDPNVLATEYGREIYDLLQAGKGAEAFDNWRTSKASGIDPMGTDENGLAAAKSGWEVITSAAEKYNQPGHFTAFIGYEWTSVPGGNNLHRNIVFRDGKEFADRTIPFSSYDSEDVEDLWNWMEHYEKTIGGKLLAIAHNGNLSNGLMFDDVTFTSKEPINADYAERRSKWEPIYEVSQMKGDGETHPALSPDDEFADFETWDKGGINSPIAKTPDMLPREYARAAYKRGLQYEAELGANPFDFGMVGSTDSHTGLATTDESQYFGKITVLEPAPSEMRFHELVAGRTNPNDLDIGIEAWKVQSGGLAAVWSRENTREALWDAMKRREVYGTTGTRPTVRVFSGWDFQNGDQNRPDMAKYGYANGVPMGGDLIAAPMGKVPTFMISALKDPNNANLDRVQIIKGWIDEAGDSHERVWDVAVSDGRVIDQNGRCRTPVGSTVNVEDASYTNSIGAAYLSAFWQDDNFDPSQRAFYYVRLLEIPTPRWTTFDANIFDREIPGGAPTEIQERAYTSPIWYTPT
jgi:uncharacterized protein DUF3604